MADKRIFSIPVEVTEDNVVHVFESLLGRYARNLENITYDLTNYNGTDDDDKPIPLSSEDILKVQEKLDDILFCLASVSKSLLGWAMELQGQEQTTNEAAAVDDDSVGNK